MTTDYLMRAVAVITVGLILKWLMIRAKNRNFSTFRGYYNLFVHSWRLILRHKWIFLIALFVALPSKIYENLINAAVQSNMQPGVKDFVEFGFNLKWSVVQDLERWYFSFNEIITANPLPAFRYNFIAIALMVILYFFLIKGRLDKLGKLHKGYNNVLRAFYPTFTISLFSIIYYLSPFYYQYILDEASFNFKYWLIYILPSAYLVLISGVVFSVVLLISAKAFFFKKDTISDDFLNIFIENFGRLFFFFFLVFLLSVIYSLFQGELLYPANIGATGTYIFNYLYSAFVWMLYFTPFIIIDERGRVFNSMEKSLSFWSGHIPEILAYFIISFFLVFFTSLLSDFFIIKGIGIGFSIYQNVISVITVLITVLLKTLVAVAGCLLFVNLKYQKPRR